MGRHRKRAKWRALFTKWREPRKSDAAPEEKLETLRFDKLPKLVDIDTLEIHLFTLQATSGQRSVYIALCGKAVTPASLVEPGYRYCARCLEYVTDVPGQRWPGQ